MSFSTVIEISLMTPISSKSNVMFQNCRILYFLRSLLWLYSRPCIFIPLFWLLRLMNWPSKHQNRFVWIKTWYISTLVSNQKNTMRRFFSWREQFLGYFHRKMVFLSGKFQASVAYKIKSVYFDDFTHWMRCFLLLSHHWCYQTTEFLFFPLFLASG